jgi:hypothetical protein
MAEPPLQRRPSFHRIDHRSVVPDARVEAEEPSVHAPESDRSEIGGVDPAGEQVGGAHRIVRHAEGAGEHVGGTARQDPERGVGAGDPGGDLVQRAVTAVADDHVDAPARRIVSEPCGVTPSVGLDDLDVVTAREPAVHHHRVARRHRRREGVDDEQDAHERIDRTSGRTGCDQTHGTALGRDYPTVLTGR